MSFIYALKCPKTLEVRYIGKADRPKSRLRSHIGDARSGATKHVASEWIRSLLAGGLEPVLEVLFKVPDGVTWQDAEKSAIAMYLAQGCKLMNSTAGGQGLKLLREEDRLALSKSLSAAWAKPGAKEARIARLKEVLATPESKARRIAAHMNPETRLKKSVAGRAALSQPEVRLALSASQKKRRANLADKAATAAASKNSWCDAEIRAKRVAGMKQAWIGRKAAKDNPP